MYICMYPGDDGLYLRSGGEAIYTIAWLRGSASEADGLFDSGPEVPAKTLPAARLSSFVNISPKDCQPTII